MIQFNILQYNIIQFYLVYKLIQFSNMTYLKTQLYALLRKHRFKIKNGLQKLTAPLHHKNQIVQHKLVAITNIKEEIRLLEQAQTRLKQEVHQLNNTNLSPINCNANQLTNNKFLENKDTNFEITPLGNPYSQEQVNLVKQVSKHLVQIQKQIINGQIYIQRSREFVENQKVSTQKVVRMRPPSAQQLAYIETLNEKIKQQLQINRQLMENPPSQKSIPMMVEKRRLSGGVVVDLDGFQELQYMRRSTIGSLEDENGDIDFKFMGVLIVAALVIIFDIIA